MLRILLSDVSYSAADTIKKRLSNALHYVTRSETPDTYNIVLENCGINHTPENPFVTFTCKSNRTGYVQTAMISAADFAQIRIV